MLLSKTDIPCDCNWLQRNADNPDRPIEFDPSVNEYNIVYLMPSGQGKMTIRHCPFCGGTAPQSKRDLLFAVISDIERFRLVELTKSLKTLSDALEALGEPDEDCEGGSVVATLEHKGQSGVTQAYRTLRYDHLSETAWVHVKIYPGDYVAIRFSGKFIGDPALPGETRVDQKQTP